MATAANRPPHCPADRGFGAAFKPTVFDVVGDSYRFNWYLEDDYESDNPPTVEDPVYNLGLKKESWVPDTARFIMIHEWAAFPYNGDATISVVSWHGALTPGKVYHPNTIKGDSDKLIAPTLFVDGHSLPCDFTTIFQKKIQPVHWSRARTGFGTNRSNRRSN